MSAPKENTATGSEPKSARGARRAGQVVQAMVLATLLSLAVMKLLMFAGVSVVFRYQGF